MQRIGTLASTPPLRRVAAYFACAVSDTDDHLVFKVQKRLFSPRVSSLLFIRSGIQTQAGLGTGSKMTKFYKEKERHIPDALSGICRSPIQLDR